MFDQPSLWYLSGSAFTFFTAGAPRIDIAIAVTHSGCSYNNTYPTGGGMANWSWTWSCDTSRCTDDDRADPCCSGILQTFSQSDTFGDMTTQPFVIPVSEFAKECSANINSVDGEWWKYWCKHPQNTQMSIHTSRLNTQRAGFKFPASPVILIW